MRLSVSVKISVLYATVSLAWIFFSDQLAAHLFGQTPDLLVVVSTAKGFFFVVATTVLLFALLYRWEQGLTSAQALLSDSEARYARVLQGSDQGFWDWNIKTNEFSVSPRFASMLGYLPDEWDISPENWAKHVHPQDLAKALISVEKNFSGELDVHELEMRCLTKSGEWTWILTRGKVVLRDEAGKPLIMSGTHTDINEHKNTAIALSQAAAVFETTQESVIITDAKRRILRVNPAFVQMSGYTEAEVLGKSPAFLKSGRHDEGFYAEMLESLDETGHWQGEVWNRRKTGEVYPTLFIVNVVKDAQGEISNYVGASVDISRVKSSEEQLNYFSQHDPLTGLPNRVLLFSRLEHAIDATRRDGSYLALLMLDLDRFKAINDSFGHLVGDQLLQQVSERLIERLRGADTLARLGGDEFCMLLENLPRPEDAARVAGELIATLSRSWLLSNGVEVSVSGSIGISVFPGHGTTAEELLQQADSALYRAKDEGRGRYQYFSNNLTQSAREKLALEARLRRAIAKNELRVHYQPQVDIRSGHIVGAEALVRWQDPDEGLIPPGRFIPLAEETGLIQEIGEWVLRETCSQGQQWLEGGMAPIVLAVNVAAHQLRHSNFNQMVMDVLAETGFPADLLELELTESALMEDCGAVVENLKVLRDQRIRLAIDDFGTGYSSLAYLKRFPLDVLKIDKSFVDEISHNRDDREIAMAIIGMGHTLGLRVLAEGVESAEQLAFLQAQGCDMYQGYFRSKPLPPDEFRQLLQAH